MIIVDVILAGLAYFLAYYLRFDGDIPAGDFANWMKTVVWIVPLKLACFFFFGIYKGMWRYTGIYDLENLIKACVISSGIIVFILVLKARAGRLHGLMVSRKDAKPRRILWTGLTGWSGYFLTMKWPHNVVGD